MEGLRERDRIVFETADAMRLPIAWNLAGGYSENNAVVEIHRQTAEECIKVEKRRQERREERNVTHIIKATVKRVKKAKAS